MADLTQYTPDMVQALMQQSRAIRGLLDPTEDEKRQALNMGFVQGGLSMLANNRGHYGAAGPAIGAGGMAGVQAYQQAMQQASEARQNAINESQKTQDQMLRQRMLERQEKTLAAQEMRDRLKQQQQDDDDATETLRSTLVRGFLSDRGFGGDARAIPVAGTAPAPFEFSDFSGLPPEIRGDTGGGPPVSPVVLSSDPLDNVLPNGLMGPTGPSGVPRSNSVREAVQRRLPSVEDMIDAHIHAMTDPRLAGKVKGKEMMDFLKWASSAGKEEKLPNELRIEAILSGLPADPSLWSDADRAALRSRLHESNKSRAGNISVSNGELQLGKAGANKVDEALLDTGARMSRLKSIESSWEPGFLTMKTQLGNKVLSFKEWAGGSLTPEQRANITRFTGFKGDVLSNVNAYIKEVTGAAMTESEAKRIMATLPNMDMGPTEFKAALDRAVRQAKMAEARLVYIKRKGLAYDFWKERPGVSLESMPMIMQTRANDITAQLKKQGVTDPVKLRDNVRRIMASEFGLVGD